MLFTLDVTTDPAARRATLRLADEAGRHLAAHEVDLGALPPATWAAACDTRAHLRRMHRSAPAEEQLADLGAFLWEKVLGSHLAGKLVEGGLGARTLLLRVPDAPDDPLAVAFAGIPWEIARAPGDPRTLLQHNVSLRVAFAGAAADQLTTVAPRGEPVRVLFVFADPPPARPLSVRLERERLRDLFFGEILPRRNVEVDVLCHGVTRERLVEAITARGGYHVVHWSGHGHVNVLALPDGTISSEALVGLFRDAGAPAPAVMLLSACHSGALAPAKDWASLRTGEGDKTDGGPLAGTALALLRAGVKQVAAMRWEVNDVYARRLARRFYRHLLADEGQHATDRALVLARGELVRDQARRNEYEAVDHATPLLLGAEAVRFAPEKKRSPQMDRQKPKPQPLLTSGSRELDPPPSFVGRGEELTRLFTEWMDRKGGKPVALIQGLAGLGKTSLAAEAIHLGFERFDYVLAFQSKGTPLEIEDLYRRIDQRLIVASVAYRERCKANAMGKVFVEAEEGFRGQERYEQLAYNLVEVMGAERILLVLDNFEMNLLVEKGEYRCKDEAWERLLEILSERIGDTGSRVLVTSRHKPAVLEGKAIWIPMGALPIAEARLYFENHAVLRAFWYGDDESFVLAKRILDVSRGHPLILARLADLACRCYDWKKRAIVPEKRAEIETALNKIQGEGFRSLPDLCAKVKNEAQRDLEYKYMNDVAIGAVDLLIERLTPAARWLLWVVTRAGEPVPGALVKDICGIDPGALLGKLCSTGLVTREGNEAYTFHELVAERTTEWMKAHPADSGEYTEDTVWQAFGTWYGRLFNFLLASREPGSRDEAVEMGRRGIRYLVRARAFESLMFFASGVVDSTLDPALLGQVIADVQVVAADAPAGKTRWHLRTYLADALRNAGRPDQALRLYEQATEEAEAAGDWSDVGNLYHNWAHALRAVGELDRAREMQRRSGEAYTRANGSPARVVRGELAALRVDVKQGRAAEALPEIEEKLADLRRWRARRQQGEPVPEELDDDHALSSFVLSGLGVLQAAAQEIGSWEHCLDIVGEAERTAHAHGKGEHELARIRLDLALALMARDDPSEARAVVEHCLEVFRRVGDVGHEARALFTLALVWYSLGDQCQALALEHQALSLRERLPDPEGRADSHNNLAIYLHAAGSPAEARSHLLAALVYRLVTGLDPRAPLNNLANRIREIAAGGEAFAFPALRDLLSEPGFAPLRAFVRERGVDVDALQARIDELVAETRAKG